QDLSELKKCYEWLTGKSPYFWRLNTRPSQNTERVLVLGCSGGDFYVNASGIGRSARGAVARRAQKI
ncbi:MAG: hypothetical protein HY363_05760, partial [Candidatus Aenigmarchaeota archaeon]|nr:hypothetical protein [Candidatus Aenigmarchaeota archaeon]